MYPTLTDFIKETTGFYIPMPVQTYGFFVALAFISATVVMMLEIKRKSLNGLIPQITKKILIGDKPKANDLIFNAIIGFLIGYKLVDAIFRYSVFVDNPQDFILSTQGNYLGGIIIALLLAGYKFYTKNKAKLPEPKWEEHIMQPQDVAGNILIIAAISGIIGAKLFHNLENFDELLEDPIGALFSFSGLTFYGGLICGSLAGIYYGHKNKIKPLYLLDAGAPAIAFGYGIGRLGCHFSGDGCWGVVNSANKPEWLSFLPDWMWAYDYPHNVLNLGKTMENCVTSHCHVLTHPVFPTSFYESSLAFITFIVLWSLRKKINIHGFVISIFLIMNGLIRFFMEKIRVNTKYHLGNFDITQAEIISVTLIFIGVILLIISIKLKNNNGLRKDLQASN